MTPTSEDPRVLSGDDPSIGTVYLVGAGPGDPGLLTVRGRAILANCDAIVYDRLAATCLPSDPGDDVELHYVGKRADHHALPQSEINQLLVTLACAGKRVCRLKGGDPFVFGRGGEEAEVLAEAGVRFEIVPGVTAGVAAAAYAGIPVTHRGEAVRVCLVTAHEDPTKDDSQVDWRAMGRDPHATIAAYMPVANLEMIAAEMIAGGADPALPAAVIERGTLPTQRTISAPLGELAARVVEADVKPPALLLVGPTVALREKLRWFQERPLVGRRVIVTRPADQARALISGLQDLGITVLNCPTIRSVAADPAEFAPFLNRLGDYDWIFFTSENGVRHFFGLLEGSAVDVRALAGVKIATVGAGTAQRLVRYGLRAEFVPTLFRSDALLKEFREREDCAGLRVLRVRGDRAPTALEEGLRAAGALVDTPLAYHIEPARPRPDVVDDVAAAGADAITFTSGSAVVEFENVLPDHHLHGGAVAVCIGPITAEAAREVGWDPVVTAEVGSVDGLVDSVQRLLIAGTSERSSS